MTDAMPQIETVVLLMLENRSLDSVLGWLHHGQTLREEQVYPPGSDRTFNGIPPGAQNSYFGTPWSPGHGTQDMADPMRVPRWNSHEIFEHVTVQMYADDTGKVPIDPWDETPPMTGFVYDFADRGTPDALDEVMGGYSRDQLPVLYGMAESFAVSDRWFCSVPTETNPNRAFSLCGTSLGALDNADIDVFDTKTIFNALTGHKTWGIAWQYRGIGSGDPKTFFPNSFTEDLFPQVHQAVERGEGVVSRYADFLDDVRNDRDIPQFCYVEPAWSGGVGCPDGTDFLGLTGNDYHAPAWVGQGEFDLNELYTALRNSRHWDRMLFIVTFDEHGGTWDHEPPTEVLPPNLPQPPQKPGKEFAFERLGPRVPTILASPYVRPGMVFRKPADSAYDFDHTSLIATLLAWAGVDPRQAGLGDRVANAPKFDGVLSDEPLTDAPETFLVPAGYANQGGRDGIHIPGLRGLIGLAWQYLSSRFSLRQFGAPGRRGRVGRSMPDR